MNLFSLEGKTAIVTGACGLLGVKHCEAMAEAGANVVVADVNEEMAIALTNKLGKGHIGIATDVTKEASLQELRDKVIAKYGRIDVLVNNAAINDMFENPQLALEKSKFENYPLGMWQKSMDVNVTGVFLCSQVLGSVMANTGGGSIINIASTYGVTAPDQNLYKDENGVQMFYKSAAYPTTKAAVLGFTRFLAAYWGNKGVRVNALSPGGVLNNQDETFIKNYSSRTVLGRMANSSDYKGALIFLASEASCYMTGSNLIVDGGWTAI